LQENSTNFQDFLANLQLKCEITRINEEQIPRVSQLSLRTNQFNSTTRRRSENDVKQLLNQANSHIWIINVQDRFGDYGLVGAIFGEEKEQNLNVDSFMLSCRALGRGIEHKMLAAITFSKKSAKNLRKKQPIKLSINSRRKLPQKSNLIRRKKRLRQKSKVKTVFKSSRKQPTTFRKETRQSSKSPIISEQRNKFFPRSNQPQTIVQSFKRISSRRAMKPSKN
jgi:FkbH-like protein